MAARAAGLEADPARDVVVAGWGQDMHLRKSPAGEVTATRLSAFEVSGPGVSPCPVVTCSYPAGERWPTATVPGAATPCPVRKNRRSPAAADGKVNPKCPMRVIYPVLHSACGFMPFHDPAVALASEI